VPGPKFRRGHPTGPRHRFVKPQFVAHHHGRGVHGRAHIHNGLLHEGLELGRTLAGDRHALCAQAFGDGRFLLWSDIPNNRIMKWEEETGAVSLFRKPSNFANGNTRVRQGRLVTCEHGGRRVTRTEYDVSITVLMDSFDGKRLNSPNDVVVKSDGSIWFTDPIFGLLGNYEGYKAEPEIGTALSPRELVRMRSGPISSSGNWSMPVPISGS